MATTTSSNSSQKPLLDFWQQRQGFGEAVGCLATTFTFDENFFERDCLARFLSLETDPTEDALGYVIEREEKLADVFACVLVDRCHAAEARTLRWRQLGVAVPGNGILHAKVSLLVWKQRIRVLVGSPNLTVQAYRKNWETLTVFDFAQASETPLDLLTHVLEFFERLVGRDRGSNRPDPSTTRAKASSFLATVKRQIKDWQPGRWKPGEASAHLLPVTPDSPSLFDQIGDLWRGTGPDRAHVVSPFWDDAEQAQGVARALVAIMGKQAQKELIFQCSGEKLPDESVNLGLPQAYEKPSTSRTEHSFLLTRARDEDQNSRELHTKAIWLTRGDECLMVVGSSNFTRAGTGSGDRGSPKNVEANIAFVMPASEKQLAKQCRAALPPADEIDRVRIRFRGSPSGEEGEKNAWPLPRRFGEALFEPVGKEGLLKLEVEPGGQPEAFTIEGPQGQRIASETDVAASGTTTLPWTSKVPPSFLTVRWLRDGAERRAAWPVNVTDASKLPPPEELRELPYEILLQVLAGDLSLQKGARGGPVVPPKPGPPPPEGAALLDPHRRVDVRGYLLRRVRLVSNAIEGLERRLERPVFTLEALRTRLLGPLGPMALARQVQEKEGSLAPFLITEIALATSAVSWAETDRYVGNPARRREVEEVVNSLRGLATAAVLDSDLERYIRESFEEVGR